MDGLLFPSVDSKRRSETWIMASGTPKIDGVPDAGDRHSSGRRSRCVYLVGSDDCEWHIAGNGLESSQRTQDGDQFGMYVLVHPTEQGYR